LLVDPTMSAHPHHSAGTRSRVGQFVIGAGCATLAIAIWAGWLVVMRLGVTTRLSAPDLTALRFVTAGLVLLPIVLRHGFAIDRLSWSGLAALVLGGGAPVALIIGRRCSSHLWPTPALCIREPCPSRSPVWPRSF
jgi:hypothetical protein